jgi:NADH dehydrogenase
VLRNHLIGCFERADATEDAARRRQYLTVVVIGGGLVGVELVGELTAFADDVLRFYPSLRRSEVCFRLLEAGPRIIPEIDVELAARATEVLERRGVEIRVGTPARSIGAGSVRLQDDSIEAATIVLTAGVVPSAVTRAIPVQHDGRGRIAVDATMQSRSHRGIWALGDCAAIPGPDGRAYPALAQYAVREARHLADNLKAALEGRALLPFTYRPRGTMASLGHTRAVARVFGVPLTGFFAWWLRRTYYLFQMPRWDRRLRIVLDWTVALFFRPDTTRVDLRVEREQTKQALELRQDASRRIPALPQQERVTTPRPRVVVLE